jgi:DNA-binding MarR family transcriptional regulator
MISNINLDLDRDFQRYFQLSIFSKKFRIMMYVMSNPGCSIKYAQAESGLSYRGFHMKLKEMLDAQLITLDDDPADGRRKRMNIGPEGRMAQQRFLDANAGDGSVTVPVRGYGAALAGE